MTEDCRTYRVALPPGIALINANDRVHWRTRARLTALIADAAIVMTREAKVPRMQRASVTAVLHPHDRRRRDPHNWAPSIKAFIDGTIRAGILPDDDAEHLVSVEIVLGEPVRHGQLALLITDLTEGNPCP